MPFFNVNGFYPGAPVATPPHRASRAQRQGVVRQYSAHDAMRPVALLRRLVLRLAIQLPDLDETGGEQSQLEQQT